MTETLDITIRVIDLAGKAAWRAAKSARKFSQALSASPRPKKPLFSTDGLERYRRRYERRMK